MPDSNHLTELEKTVARHDVMLASLEKRMAELHVDIRLLHTGVGQLTTQIGILTAKLSEPAPRNANTGQLAAVGTVSGAIGAAVTKLLHAAGITF